MIEVVLRESVRVVRQIGPVLITETRHGFVCANAGVDQSSSGVVERVLTLPVDPDASARRLRSGFRDRGFDVAVVITDTFGRPWREGQTDIAIGIAGMSPLLSYIGQHDPHGHEFRVQEICVADELAAAAELVKATPAGCRSRSSAGGRGPSTTTPRCVLSSATRSATCSADARSTRRTARRSVRERGWRRGTVDRMPSVEPQTGITISYDVTGAGRALALVHGITEHRGAWGGLVDRFVDAGYRVLAIDLRGHGESSKVPPYDLVTMAGDLAAVLAAEDATDALLVGHSLGGAVVSACAASAPCRGVVNVDQPLALSAFKDVLAQLEPALRGSPSQFDAAITAIFDSMAGALAGAERARIEGLRGGDQDVVLGVWDVVLTSSAAELDATIDAVAAAIEVPCLSLHGIDPGEGYSEWLTSRIASATVEIWPEAGHYPHLVEPARFVDRVTEFDVARCRG